jgi:hypothetical protein
LFEVRLPVKLLAAVMVWFAVVKSTKLPGLVQDNAPDVDADNKEPLVAGLLSGKVNVTSEASVSGALIPTKLEPFAANSWNLRERVLPADVPKGPRAKSEVPAVVPVNTKLKAEELPETVKLPADTAPDAEMLDAEHEPVKEVVPDTLKLPAETEPLAVIAPALRAPVKEVVPLTETLANELVPPTERLPAVTVPARFEVPLTANDVRLASPEIPPVPPPEGAIPHDNSPLVFDTK